jgi:hypothetical protein
MRDASSIWNHRATRCGLRKPRSILRFPSSDACRTWLRRHQIVSLRRGRVIVVHGYDVDRVLRKTC